MGRALRLLGGQVADHPCRSFAALPRGRTLRQLVDDSIWVNYDPRRVIPGRTDPLFGWQLDGYPRDIVIGEVACAMGRWTLVGTMVHELAHLNGANGHSHEAEETLRGCGLAGPGGPYDPSVRG